MVWERYSDPRGSGHVSVPRGWRVTFGDGSVEATRPGGENVTLGFRLARLLPEWATQWTTVMQA